EVFDYYRAALTRLEEIALRDRDPLAEDAFKHIGDHLKDMLSFNSLFDELREMIERLHTHYPRWYQPIKAVDTLLYFSVSWKVPEDYHRQLREYYDELLPKQSVDLLLLYSSGGSIDFHDPDVPYNRDEVSDHDFNSRQIDQIIRESPPSSAYFFPLLDEFLSGRYNLAPSVLQNISRHISDTEVLLGELIAKISSETEIPVAETLVRGVIVGAHQKDQSLGLNSLHTALSVDKLKPYGIHLISAVELNDDLMRQAIELIKTDVVDPFQAVHIAWDDYLEKITPALTKEFLQTIQEKGANGAWATIRFLSSWLYSFDIKQVWQVEPIIQSVTNPALFECEQYSHTDWYSWRHLIENLINGGYLTEDICCRLLRFIISSVDLQNFDIQLSFEDNGQQVLHHLISSYPNLVWEKYIDKKEALEEANTLRLQCLFDADFRNASAGGVLSNLPVEIYVPWMLDDKQNRLKFILSWIGLFDGREDSRSWAPKFIDFINTYIDAVDQLDPIHSRLTTGGWIGSYSSMLEEQREHLKQLEDVSGNVYVKQWVYKTLTQMDRSIADQRRRDANFDATNRA
ncbi:MAG: hypothetical protein WBA51_10225, partial [Erythrobacter sp.]